MILRVCYDEIEALDERVHHHAEDVLLRDRREFQGLELGVQICRSGSDSGGWYEDCEEHDESCNGVFAWVFLPKIPQSVHCARHCD